MRHGNEGIIVEVHSLYLNQNVRIAIGFMKGTLVEISIRLKTGIMFDNCSRSEHTTEHIINYNYSF